MADAKPLPESVKTSSNASSVAHTAVASAFSDLRSVLTFVVSQASVIGVLAYVCGFLYIQNYYDESGISRRASDLPANVLYSYALSIFGRRKTEVLSYITVLTVLFIGTLFVAKFRQVTPEMQRFLIAALSTGAIVWAILTAYLWASRDAHYLVMSSRVCSWQTRVAFVLTHEAKHKYDKTFLSANYVVGLQLIHEAPDVIYAMRRNRSRSGEGWNYYTYAVPRGDTTLIIRLDPAGDPNDSPKWCK